jgi:hypothetical protein
MTEPRVDELPEAEDAPLVEAEPEPADHDDSDDPNVGSFPSVEP